MKYFIIVVSIIILLIIIKIIISIYQNNSIEKLLKENEGKYKLIKANKKAYQYVLKSDDLDIYLCILKVPKYSQICINSQDTWKLSYNYMAKDKGSAYQNSRYVDELKHFLASDIKTDKNYLKVIFVYKRFDEIVRYLNESELDVVDINKTPYGYKITSYENFVKDLDVLLKK